MSVEVENIGLTVLFIEIEYAVLPSCLFFYLHFDINYTFILICI